MRELQEEARSASPTCRSCRSRSSTRSWRLSTTWWCVASGRARERLPELEPILVYLQVALLAGPEVAARSGES